MGFFSKAYWQSSIDKPGARWGEALPPWKIVCSPWRNQAIIALKVVIKKILKIKS